MPEALVKRRSREETRQRILEAAIIRFSQHTYEETGLRDVASDAGVDVALVNRYFGSKEQLFIEAVESAFQIDEVLSAEKRDLGRILARRALEPSLDGVLKLVSPLDIVVRSLSSSQAVPILGEFITKNFIGPLSAKLVGHATERATVAAACLLGISLFRNVLFPELLRHGGSTDVEPLVAAIVDLAIGNNPS